MGNYAVDITPGTAGSLQQASHVDSYSFEFYPGPIGNCDSASQNIYNVFGK